MTGEEKILNRLGWLLAIVCAVGIVAMIAAAIYHYVLVAS